MPHNSPLIGILVFGLGLAFILGTVANRLRTSLLVGYLLAGVAIGPFTPGFVADQALALQLAEIGVILLMFGVGLHFSVDDLIEVRAVAIPGALLQVVLATAMGETLAWFMDLDLAAGLVFGLALSVASTVVLLRTMQEHRLMNTRAGHIAVGWLVTQDLVTVLALVLLPIVAPLLRHDGTNGASRPELAFAIVVTLAKVLAFVGLMLLVGRRIIPAILHYVAHTGSRELFRLAVLAVALGVAFTAAEIFGVSFALGAFVAGMVLHESQLSQRAAEETLPLRDAFAVLFFVSVGMLFDPTVLIHDPLPLLGTLAVVLIGTPVVAFLIMCAFRQPLSSALTIAAGLAQIGEFSFILVALGVGLDLLDGRIRDLVLGASILSIFFNPIMFFVVRRVVLSMERKAEAAAGPAIGPVVPEAVSHEKTELRDHAILVGYGRVGRLIADGLLAAGTRFLVLEAGDATVQPLRDRGIEVLIGNAADPDLLRLANIAQARLLLVAIPEAFEVRQIVLHAREENPTIDIIARAHFDAEVDYLSKIGAGTVVMGEREIARSMLEHAAEAPARHADGTHVRAADASSDP
jgi:CPA2 family monovalent cation:H+ antiporter-2